jgi:hypothetical protein
MYLIADKFHRFLGQIKSKTQFDSNLKKYEYILQALSNNCIPIEELYTFCSKNEINSVTKYLDKLCNYIQKN